MSQAIIAECPACRARYQVTPGQLKIAEGQVRCGQCLTVFNAIKPTPAVRKPQPRIRLDDIVPEPSEQRPTKPSKPSAPARPSPQPRRIEPPVDLLTLVQQLEFDPPRISQPLTHRPSQGWAILGCLIALLTLAGQYLWFERATLAKDPLLQPIYAPICSQLDCSLSAKAGLSDLHTTYSLVRERPEESQTLELMTDLQNRSALAVQLPILRLMFTNVQGQVVAANDFTPEQYLSGTRIIGAQQQLEIRLLIQKPSDGHLGYQIDWIAASPAALLQ